MVKQGVLKLDDPIQIYLPNAKVPEAGGKKITLRHLATHTSGLPRMPDNFNPQDPIGLGIFLTNSMKIRNYLNFQAAASIKR
jgi:CubicO group peptidase (beta-lactamase class C family)